MVRRAAHLAIRTYQLTLSGLIGRQCRHWPSCSEYAAEAVERYGVVRGGLKSLGRLLRCHPLAQGGYDPVEGGRAGTRTAPQNSGLVIRRSALGEK